MTRATRSGSCTGCIACARLPVALAASSKCGVSTGIRQYRTDLDARKIGDICTHRLREPPQAELAYDIGGNEGLPNLAKDRTNVNQGTGTLPAEDRQHQPRSHDRRDEIGIDDPPMRREIAL